MTPNLTVSPRSIRRPLVSAYRWAITLGLLISAGVDEGIWTRKDIGAYRISIALHFAWALILMTGLVFLPESPRWYVKEKRFPPAATAITRLRGLYENTAYVQQELQMLRDNCDQDYGKLGNGRPRWIDCFKGGWTPGSNLRKTLVGMTL